LRRKRDPGSRLRIVVLGYLVRGPLGGLAWHHLQYVIGFSRLGHDVYFIEDSDDYASCYDPARDVTDEKPDYGLRFASRAMERLGFADRWAYYDAHSARWFGGCADRAMEICSGADLVVNVSAVNPLRPWLVEVPVRAFIDTDPVFTQVRHLNDAPARVRAEAHTSFFTFGENLTSNTSLTPDDGFAWRATRQPVVLDAWKPTAGRPEAPFTTVMQWDSYPEEEHAGVTYGMKSASLVEFLDLPAQTSEVLELSIGTRTAPRGLLSAKGWRLRDPREPTRDPWSYQDYIRSSKGEFGIAKHGYVASRSGWFSERTAAYLASGRPAVVQETGFSDWLDSGDGVVPFSTLGEAAAALEATAHRYEHHCRAARAVAEEYFDSAGVLSKLVDDAFSTVNVDSEPLSHSRTTASARLGGARNY
jgi:hypothetical protein